MTAGADAQDPTTERHPFTGPVFGGRPTVIGHRGMGKGSVDGFLENTHASLLRAVEAGLRWVEFDVRRTGDDHLVVGHWATVPDDSFLARISLAEALDRGALTLEDYLAGLPDGIGLNIDLKTSVEDALRPLDRGTAALVAPVATELARERPVLVSSFDASAVLHLREAAPTVRRGLLTWISFPLRKSIPSAVHLGADVVAAHVRSFLPGPKDSTPHLLPTAESVDIAHRAGVEVMAWCPAPEPARELLAAGVDAVVVDDVPRSLEALADVAD